MIYKVAINSLLIFFLLSCPIAKAQEKIPLFSPSLFTGTEYYRGNTKRPATVKKIVTPIVRRRSVLRFQEGVATLTEDQKKQLIPFVESAQRGQISKIQVTAFSTTYYHSYLRILAIQRYFKAYVPKLKIYGREANVESVMESNNNTVDIVEIQ